MRQVVIVHGVDVDPRGYEHPTVELRPQPADRRLRADGRRMVAWLEEVKHPVTRERLDALARLGASR